VISQSRRASYPSKESSRSSTSRVAPASSAKEITPRRHARRASSSPGVGVAAARCSSPIAAPHPPAPSATVDVCPVTGRGRLSYERAEYLFKRHSRRISGTGLTLHQLRHSALTTLADANVSLPLLMGKSRHKNLRSLQRYVHPSAEAVAAMTAAHDPAARRRQH